MTDKFLSALEAADRPVDDNVALTENGALAFRTTKSAVLDFFATGGALRSRDNDAALAVFQRAYYENPLLAVKALFYFRDIRGGQGERGTFRLFLNWLAENHPDSVRPNLNLIAEYGRWDDLYALVDTPLERAMFAVIDMQLAHDKQADHPSLLAKWLKSENTSSGVSRRLGRKTRKALEMSPRAYRKMLSALRKRIDLVEQRISKNEWRTVEYDKIPSKAGLQYRKAFKRHDEERYAHFLNKVQRGEAKINAGTLYPYELVEKVLYQNEDSATVEAMWKNLPDYFDGTDTRGLVVADVSASMNGRPLAVSISLAMYTAERMTGPFAGKFLTFSERPKLQSVEGDTLAQRIRNLNNADWDMNTDIEAVFALILKTAVKHKMEQNQLPTHLYIVSDMEFDAATGEGDYWDPNPTPSVDERLFQTIARKYAEAGYKMPFLVFWNVDSRNDQQPMSMDERGFQMVSGCSPSIFTSLMKNKAVSAYDLMLEVLNDERYAPISVD